MLIPVNVGRGLRQRDKNPKSSNKSIEPSCPVETVLRWVIAYIMLYIYVSFLFLSTFYDRDPASWLMQQVPSYVVTVVV